RAHQEDLRTRELQEKVAQWLRERQFVDVNTPKVTCFGLRRTSPLVQAARDRDVAMVVLLVSSGADPAQKDPLGYTVFDYLKSQALRQQIRRLRSKIVQDAIAHKFGTV
ncbi:unnamed protein product, partial [Effrenium voratum]